MPTTIRYLGASGFQLSVPDEGLALTQCTALVGRSGSGKSTLVRALAGDWTQLELARGLHRGKARSRRRFEVPAEAIELREQLSILGQVVAVHQEASGGYLPLRTVGGHQWLLRHLYGVEQADAFVQHLTALGIDFDASRQLWPSELSGGQQRRLALALVLVFRPQLLILDEALASLDFLAAESVMGHLRELMIEQGLKVILVSHDLYSLGTHTDSAIAVHEGKLSHHYRGNATDIEWIAKLRGELI
ncbi:MAG: energy-coupling factor ABC transporter ATP-binding protein [Armatimonadetes bacterium]|nr:energy-coupling factor ABC transporter ATP-binding protein [Armatimonadota bacterium]